MSGDKGDWVGRIGYVVSSLVVTEEEVHGANRGMAGKRSGIVAEVRKRVVGKLIKSDDRRF